MDFIKKHSRYSLLAGLALAAAFIWTALYRQAPSAVMTVAFLNVGQGDALYIESPTRQQVIIDGGPGQALLTELGKIMPWYDRSIDVIMVTNPDKDHYAGFIDLVRRYDVGLLIEPGTKTESESYALLEQLVGESGIPKILARRGMRIQLGGGAHIDILFPDKDVSNLSTNDGSIIAQLTYGSSTVMLTGDATSKTEEYVLSLDGERLDSDILKVAHHGSRTSDSEPFIYAVSPKYAVISAGLDNSYKHPHQETLDLLEKYEIETLITFEEGTIMFHCTIVECERRGR